jgi:ribonuclease Z
MKKLILLLVVVVVATLVYTQRATLAQRIFPRAVEAAMSTDLIGSLPDGLHVALCGAGGPMPDPKRSGACVAVVAGKTLFVVDAGTGGMRNLGALRYPLGEIHSVLLTHFHSDHIDGLGEMATLRWVSGNNTEALPVIGPEGVQSVVEGFNRAYAQDAPYRTAHHGEKVAPSSGHGMTALPYPLPAAGESVSVYNQDGISIDMFTVDHAPVDPAVGYLFRYKGRSVLVSGDTAKSPNVQHFAKGVDLLVHEALSPTLVLAMNQAAENLDNWGMAKITIDILDYHASPVEAAETARDSGAGHLLYYHVVPPLIFPGSEAVWLQGVDDVFSDYTLGEDGTSFSLPAGSDKIELTRKGM